MNCPTCGLPLGVRESRRHENKVHRRRECADGHRFTTREEIIATNRGGRTAPEIEERVRESLSAGLSQRVVAAHFDICVATVRRIAKQVISPERTAP